jgi:hypothetical protein
MKFAEKLAEMVNEGLENFGPQVSAEMSRLGTQGTMELAGALFHGSAFVPYGPGQYTPTPELGEAPQVDAPQVELEQEHSRGR